MDALVSGIMVISTWLVWPILIYGLFFSANANVRWLMFFLILIQFASHANRAAVDHIGLPGWSYHVGMIGVYWWSYRSLAWFRPAYAARLAHFSEKIKFVRHILPNVRQPRLYPAELLLRYVYIGALLMHCLVLCHYLAVALSVYQQLGLPRRSFFDAALMLNGALTLCSVPLFLSLVVPALRQRRTKLHC